eukprot:CAMPEP_0176025288 /NCGR_PEP_ID=MMETSP0120_2-20121206/12369_1 /TAXON_ID=160619 /ORGANISM="Kryptoperidinium foliaceum, Strain CCMP 1326" /LENGTH=183 /DNA_ID=CAMNT_0017358471 /DNA_START=165 /DNA_END=720 /DNA_ORIENTATION=+
MHLLDLGHKRVLLNGVLGTLGCWALSTISGRRLGAHLLDVPGSPPAGAGTAQLLKRLVFLATLVPKVRGDRRNLRAKLSDSLINVPDEGLHLACIDALPLLYFVANDSLCVMLSTCVAALLNASIFDWNCKSANIAVSIVDMAPRMAMMTLPTVGTGSSSLNGQTAPNKAIVVVMPRRSTVKA